MHASAWSTPSLSTSSTEAADLYRDGVAALVSGGAQPSSLLTAAVAADHQFVLAHVAVGVVDFLAGRPFPTIPEGAITRGERQHAEIVRVSLTGDVGRGADLRREHLLEFPGDLLIACLPLLIDRRIGGAR